LVKNIYNLFREYKKLETDTQRSKYIASLDFNIRETFRSLMNFANNTDRFENIYDGWINSLEEELVVLEVYSVILKTRKSLKEFCVDDKTYEEFIESKKKMLYLLLKNDQYIHASNLLSVYMFSKDFEERKLQELESAVLSYLIEKKMVLPKKLIVEIYKWANTFALPSYLVTDVDGDFKFVIKNDVMPIESLKKDVEDALNKKPNDLQKIVNNLVENNRV